MKTLRLQDTKHKGGADGQLLVERQTGRQTDGQKSRWTERQTDEKGRQTDKQTDSKAGRQTGWPDETQPQ